MTKYTFLLAALAGCDMLGPRVSDVTIDAQKAPEKDAMYWDASGPVNVLPPGSTVPSIAENAELFTQLKLYDGLSDNALAGNGGIVTRSDGKAAGVPVKYWSFGAVALADNFIVSAPVYILADDDGAGNLTPRTDHPWLFDSLPGDQRYSAMRRIIYVPVTSKYAGELLTSVDALAEAITLGLVGEPKPAGTWRNMPVVPPDTKLEIATGMTADSTKVYARGYVVDTFLFGGTKGLQPLRNGSIPMGQEARLLSGVAAGTPPSLPTSPHAQPVFQYGVPAADPTTSFNYTPVVTQLDVRLATNIDPSTINHDNQLFARSGSGGITGYYPANVASYVVTTTVNNRQLQFAEGAP